MFYLRGFPCWLAVGNLSSLTTTLPYLWFLILAVAEWALWDFLNQKEEETCVFVAHKASLFPFWVYIVVPSLYFQTLDPFAPILPSLLSIQQSTFSWVAMWTLAIYFCGVELTASPEGLLCPPEINNKNLYVFLYWFCDRFRIVRP